VKILDFGLAKLTQPEKAGPQTSLPTETAGTEPGVVLGTLGYMSPEQVRGKPADARSDIFAFGAILYEMLSGKRAFHGDSAADTMSTILREDPPDLSSTNRLIAPALDRIVRHCLEKNPEARFHSAHDLAFDLEALSGAEVPGAPVAVAPPTRRPKLVAFLVGVAVVGLLLAAALAIFAGLRSRREPAGNLVRFSVPVPPGTTYAPGEVSRGVSISPDGTRLVIEALSGGRRHLFVRPLDSDQTTELEGTDGASAHFWSPDSRFIAFFADRKLKKIPAAGGPAEDICDADFAVVGTWNRDGTILFAGISPTGIFRVSDRGGNAIRVTTPSSHELAHLWPHFLPDGRRFLYLGSTAGLKERAVFVSSLDSKERRAVAPIHSRFEYAPPGNLVFARDGALFAQSFDEKKALLTGEPHLLAPSVHYFFGPAHATFSVSQTGAVAYQTAEPPSRLLWFDRAGREVGGLGQPSVMHGIRISPDGDRVAVAIENQRTGTSNVWVFELDRGVSTRLHGSAVDEKLPVWSPDGSKVLYRSDQKGPPDVHEIGVGSPGSERPVLERPGVQQPEDVSRDGRLLVYLNDTQARAEIWLLPLQGEPRPSPWLRSPFNVSSPRFSPDGRWIAYESDESGRPEIYVALTDGAGEKKRLSPAGGRQPRWRRDGKEVEYLAPDGFVMAVPVTLGTKVEAGVPARLFRVDPEIQDYDVAPDGSRFLISTSIEKAPESPLRVILNWTAALKKEK
ncbi:MAG TPA: protein kinase, partial [Thermoanaerobaculia bacterium]